MKRLISTLLIIILSLGAMAQMNPGSRNLRGNVNSGQSFGGERGGDKLGGDKNKSMTAADSARLLIKPKMILWTWSHDGVYKNLSKRDTTIDYFHIYNMNVQNYISSTYTGNICGPHISNIFINRNTRTNYNFLKVYDAYLTRPEDFKQTNTTTPFTELNYKTGGSKVSGDNYFRVLHTQNISPFLNAGIHFNYLKGNGSYMHNKSTIYDVAFFGNYEKDRLAIDFFTNNNIGSFEENGGIEDPTFIRDTTINSEDIPVKLMYPESSFQNINIKATAQYNIGKAKEIVSGKDTSNYYPIKLVYSFQQDYNTRKYGSNVLKEGYYNHTYIKKDTTLDRNEYHNFNNAFKIVWNEEKNSLKPGMYAGLTSTSGRYEYYNERANTDPTKLSSFSINKNKFSTQYLEGGIFKRDSGKMNFDINAKLAFTGTYSDERFLNASIDLNVNENNTFAFEGHYSNKAPSENLQYYFSNHLKWDNNFKYEKDIQFKARYINKKADFELGLVANQLDNHIQFNSDSTIVQYSDKINIYTAYAQHHLKIWKLHFVNKLYFQKTNSDLIDLPKLTLFSSYYIKGYLFNNALLAKFGAELRYNTKFYAPNYNVAISSFYSQRDEKFGNYPKVDLVLDLKVKRMTIFIKYEHLTYHYGNNDYFLNAYNAMEPAMLKYGFKWIFND